LFDGRTQRAYLELLFPLASVVTPHDREAGMLIGRPVSTVDEAVVAAEALAAETGVRCVVIKSGRHEVADPTGAPEAVDVVWHAGQVDVLTAPWIETGNTHGSGCTFAAATAARLACGDSTTSALRAAKQYVNRAIAGSAGWRLGAGHGPLAWEWTSGH